MPHRDELEAAQQRIAALEHEVRELKEPMPPAVEDATPAEESSGLPRRRTGRALIGFPLFIAFLAASCALGQPLCGRACGAMTSSTEPAMTALRACPRAHQLLGDDMDWGMVGCSNCEGEGGGDPLNGGCHSNSNWQMPVSGSRGRGSYSWGFSQSPGKSAQFTGGHVTMANGENLSIGPNGCD